MKYKVGDVVFSTIWKKSVLIKDIRPNRFYLIADLEYLSRTMVTYESNLKSREDDIEKDMEEHSKIVDEIMTIQGIEPIETEMEQIIHCPEGYQFVDENGNVINATKIVLEKKKNEYPKTYGYCCDTLECCSYNVGFDRCETPYDDTLHNMLLALRKLIICRDAYWKIAGDEMGLGKPWEPDWTNEHQLKYTIYTMGNDVIRHVGNYIHAILAFPTEEMRDAFYENFKGLINECKELL